MDKLKQPKVYVPIVVAVLGVVSYMSGAAGEVITSICTGVLGQ